MDLKKLSPMQVKQIEAADDAIAELQRKKELVAALPAHLNYKDIVLGHRLPLIVTIVVDDLDSVFYLLNKFKPLWLDRYEAARSEEKGLYQVKCQTFGYRQIYLDWQTRFKNVGIYIRTTPIELTQAEVLQINEKHKLKPCVGAKFCLYNWQNLRVNENATGSSNQE